MDICVIGVTIIMGFAGGALLGVVGFAIWFIYFYYLGRDE